MSIKHTARKWLNSLGWNVTRFDPLHSEALRLVRQLQIHKADIVFDIGANTGQFAQKLGDAGFSGRLVSFEAASAAHEALKKKAARTKNWIVAPQMALGDSNGTISLNIAANSASSSVLPMLSSHVNADPKSRYIGTETVQLRTLDSLAAEYISSDDRIFIKLDVQGFEYNVLRGANSLLENVVGLQAELSLVPLYDGEHLFEPMWQNLNDRGFELWSLIPGLIDPKSGRLLQLDAVFFRNKSRQDSALEACHSTLN
jgi:FkbM family methyltransferase